MNIHEFQANALFGKYGVPAPKGVPAKTVAEIDARPRAVPRGMVVVKSQIHAGGRGKGTFT